MQLDNHVRILQRTATAFFAVAVKQRGHEAMLLACLEIQRNIRLLCPMCSWYAWTECFVLFDDSMIECVCRPLLSGVWEEFL